MKVFNTHVMIFLVTLFLFNGCGCNNTSYSVSPSGTTASSLQYDGIYQSQVINDGGAPFWQYVRFYEDGTVISVSSTGTPAEISIWFKKENIANGTFAHGQFEINDSQLIFTTTSANGTVDYVGTFQDEVLTLNSHSNINDVSATRTYTFVQISED